VKIVTTILTPAAILAISLAPALGSAWARNSAAPPQAAPTSAPTGTAGSGGTSHTTKAVNYRHANGSVKIIFQATDLLKGAIGEAKVQAKNNRMEVEAKFERIDDATKFGLQYLTYVLWAISPEGRAENLGELILKNGSAELDAGTEMQTFGMIVTAEPYFAVTQPGDMVVLENNPTAASGNVENIDATFELLGRGAYSSSNTKIEGAIFGIDRNTPLELFEARNAVRIAGNAGAGKYAASAWAKTQQELASAEDAYRQKRDRKVVEAASRDAAETAEDARVMSVKKKAEEDAQGKILADKQAAEQREAQARAQAEVEAQRRQQAEQAQAAAERMKQEAQQAAEEAAKQKAQAEAAQQAALAQQQAAEAKTREAQAETEKARQSAAQAEAEKTQLRAQLLQQFNAVLQTQDSARGLIVNMSDVLFDIGSAELKPATREKLAKISGILLAHPGLMLQIEGYTDSTGSDALNMELSGMRADSVRDYLAQQGVPVSSMTAQGFGKAQPVASNDTLEGRQKNRRVELVVNGDAIGKPNAAPPAASSAPGPGARPIPGASAANQPN
jgi:outer membrane protein OmpA-like peptidoglycan-associated protein